MPRPSAAPILASLLAALAAPVPATAQGGPAHTTLIPGWRGDDGAHVAAIDIHLSPGWHTYWRAPGAGGIPPQFDWSASENLRAVRYEWPRPVVFESYGITAIGYERRLTLPVRLEPIDPSKPIAARVEIFYGVCDDICIPAEASLEALLPVTGPVTGRLDIEGALARRPMSAAAAGIASVTCTLTPDGNGYALTTEVTFARPPGPDQHAVVETSDPGLWIGLPESRMDGNRLVAETRIEGGSVIDRSGLRVTVLDPTRAVDILGCDAPD